MGTLTSEAFNSSNPYELAIAFNTATNNWLGHMLLIAWFSIILLSTIGFGFGKSFAAASFSTFVIAVMLMVAGLVPQYDLFICLGMAAVGIIALYVDRDWGIPFG